MVNQLTRNLGRINRENIVSFLKDNPGWHSVNEISDNVRASNNSIRCHLANLTNAGIVIMKAERTYFSNNSFRQIYYYRFNLVSSSSRSKATS